MQRTRRDPEAARQLCVSRNGRTSSIVPDGEGLVGQCALEKESILLTNVPTDYIHISSGLGEAPPLNIIVLPVLFEGQVKAVIELASFQPVQRGPPGVPRSAHGKHRYRAEHDRGDDEDGSNC